MSFELIKDISNAWGIFFNLGKKLFPWIWIIDSFLLFLIKLRIFFIFLLIFSNSIINPKNSNFFISSIIEYSSPSISIFKIVEPVFYGKRFCDAMKKYFMSIPMRQDDIINSLNTNNLNNNIYSQT